MDTATKVFNKFKDGTLPWLELDMSFKPFTDHVEFAKLEHHYVPHRDKETHTGWSSCCLHGLGVDKTQVAKEYGYDDECDSDDDYDNPHTIVLVVLIYCSDVNCSISVGIFVNWMSCIHTSIAMHIHGMIVNT